MDYDTDPKGKRTARRSAVGNMIGYIGGRRWEVITSCGIEPYTKEEEVATAAWLAGDPNWLDAPWLG